MAGLCWKCTTFTNAKNVFIFVKNVYIQNFVNQEEIRISVTFIHIQHFCKNKSKLTVLMRKFIFFVLGLNQRFCIKREKFLFLLLSQKKPAKATETRNCSRFIQKCRNSPTTPIGTSNIPNLIISNQSNPKFTIQNWNSNFLKYRFVLHIKPNFEPS